MERNPGVPLDPDLVLAARVDRGAVESRVAALSVHRPGEDKLEVARLLRAVASTDLTTLAGDDTPGRVRRLCAKARSPLSPRLLEALANARALEAPGDARPLEAPGDARPLEAPGDARPLEAPGDASPRLTVAAVCVYPVLVPTAIEALAGSGIPVASVAAGFPAGLTPLELRVGEIRAAVASGAAEIDAVIARRHVLAGDWTALYDEVKRFREACGEARLKTILAAGELRSLTNVARAALVCMMAGTDFVKTSTGKERVNATLPVGLVLARTIRRYRELTGHPVGCKAAGGISKASQALGWLILVEEELGEDWLRPALFRFGASSLLADVERRLEERAGGA